MIYQAKGFWILVVRDGALGTLLANRGSMVASVDPMGIALSYAKVDRRLGLVEGMTQLPFSDSTFEVVTMIETLEHIADGDDVIAIQELERVLCEDGLVVITVPHLNNKVADKHYRHYTVDSLSKFVNGNTDLEVLRVATFKERLVGLSGKLHGRFIRAGFYLADHAIRSVNGNLGLIGCKEINADGILMVARKK